MHLLNSHDSELDLSQLFDVFVCFLLLYLIACGVLYCSTAHLAIPFAKLSYL